MEHHETFPLFPLLPAEIRIDIWQLSCHARVVEATYNAEEDRCVTTTAPPPVLHACHESRQEALRVYKKLFATKTHEATTFFHPEKDTLYLPRPSEIGYDNNSRDFAQLVTDAAEVKNLALDHVNPLVRRPWETYNKYALMQSFPEVAEVYLVLAEPEPEPEEKHGFLALAEPRGDPGCIYKLLADVKESFSYEVGLDFEIGDEEHKAHPLVLKSKVSNDYLPLL